MKQDSYLDIGKSVIISSPAGSGKTEKLARRYIALLQADSPSLGVEKILCLTFTEKAAAEMKDRILRILKAERPALYDSITGKIPLMRISTIHSFCLRLLKRFSLELGLDPAIAIADDHTARTLWHESIYEELIAGRNNQTEPSSFFRMTTERGIRGFKSLQRLLNDLYDTRPYSEMALKGTSSPAEALLLYGQCLKRYENKKKARHVLDFDDLEALAYDALAKNPEWHNILYAFDEHTDHILVDEFQDTSTLQWKIIEKLTEEWRSGLGAKREAGALPTLFLVGDEKQSIYQFRGANVSVFSEAKENLAKTLEGEFEFIQVRENYRSLPEIVNFTNTLFSKLMPQELFESWRTKYSPFMAVREGKGSVELVFLEGGEEGTKNFRINEADALTKRINYHVGRTEVYEGDALRPCRYADMAVLLRKRTHLGLFEDAFRHSNIPFVVLKGIGFYGEPETALLREFISFLADPTDDYSLFCLLRSPLFSQSYKALRSLLKGNRGLFDNLRISNVKRHREIAVMFEGWIQLSASMPLARLIEQALIQCGGQSGGASGGWSRFWEKQRHANVKKFIALIEHYESEGASILEIRDKLLRQRDASEVARANINAEGMNAVKIMTVHAAKGLQFPMVFIPSLEESASPRGTSVLIDEDGDSVALAIVEESEERNKNEHFIRKKQKEAEEEKRLFYVAVTRAMDHLCLLGTLKEGAAKSGRLSYLNEAFDILTPGPDLPFDLLRMKDVEAACGDAPCRPAAEEPFMEFTFTGPLPYTPKIAWSDATSELTAASGHGKDWIITGTIMHKLFEELSKAIIGEEDIHARLNALVKTFSPSNDAVGKTVLADIEKLRQAGYMESVILPRKASYAELPFMLEKGKRVFKGRLDRLIIEPGMARIYDYKTFPVRDAEKPELIYKYRFQMEIYREAVERLFNLETKAYILFTHIPEMVEL